jgi:hypothetical protein
MPKQGRRVRKAHTDGGTSVAAGSEDEAPGTAAASSLAEPMVVDGSVPSFDEELSEPGERPPKSAKVAGPIAGAEASSEAAAAPAPPGLMEIMLRLEQKVTTMAFDMARTNQRLEHQDDKFLALDQHIASAVGALDTRFETFKEEVNSKLAELSLAPPPSASASSGLQPGQRKAPWEKKPTATEAAPGASASSAASPTIPKPAVHSSSTPVAGKNTNPNRLWIKGFGTTQTSMLMATSAKAYIADLPPDLRVGARVQAAGFGVAIAVVFPSRESADLAFPILRELQHTFLDPRTKVLEKLRVTRDLPFAVRSRNRVQGMLWTKVKEHLVNSKIEFSGLAQSNGTLFVIVGESPIDVFKIKSIKEGETSRFEASASFANLLSFGISREVASDWADDASGAQLG